jgi:PAS domain-containing protein
MFSNVPDTELAAHDVVDPSELVVLSVLQLDLEPPSTGGWDLYLAARGIPVIVDDIGRRAIFRADARLLITERQKAEQRQREAAERQAAELEHQRLASLMGGKPTDQIPEGVAAATWMVQAAKDAEPKRRTVLEEVLANRGDLTYRPVRDEQ